MSILNNLWVLIKSGFVLEEERTLRQSVKFLYRLFLMLILFKIIYFTSTFLIKTIDLNNFPVVSKDFEVDTLSGIYQFLILAFITPIIEELTFRLGLRFTKFNFIVMICGFTYIISKLIFQLHWSYTLIIIAFIAIILTVILKQQLLERLASFWENNRLFVFYFLLVSFSTPHILNYEMSIATLLYLPLLMLPHFLAGLVFSYARLKSGIVLSISLHILNNGLFTIPLLFLD